MDPQRMEELEFLTESVALCSVPVHVPDEAIDSMTGMQHDFDSLKDRGATGRWTDGEHSLFEEGLRLHGRDWKLIADLVQSRTIVQIRTHAQKYFAKVAKTGPTKPGTVSAADGDNSSANFFDGPSTRSSFSLVFPDFPDIAQRGRTSSTTSDKFSAGIAGPAAYSTDHPTADQGHGAFSSIVQSSLSVPLTRGHSSSSALDALGGSDMRCDSMHGEGGPAHHMDSGSAGDNTASMLGAAADQHPEPFARAGTRSRVERARALSNRTHDPTVRPSLRPAPLTPYHNAMGNAEVEFEASFDLDVELAAKLGIHSPLTGQAPDRPFLAGIQSHMGADADRSLNRVKSGPYNSLGTAWVMDTEAVGEDLTLLSLEANGGFLRPLGMPGMRVSREAVESAVAAVQAAEAASASGNASGRVSPIPSQPPAAFAAFPSDVKLHHSPLPSSIGISAPSPTSSRPVSWRSTGVTSGSSTLTSSSTLVSSGPDQTTAHNACVSAAWPLVRSGRSGSGAGGAASPGSPNSGRVLSRTSSGRDLLLGTKRTASVLEPSPSQSSGAGAAGVDIAANGSSVATGAGLMPSGSLAKSGRRGSWLSATSEGSDLLSARSSTVNNKGEGTSGSSCTPASDIETNSSCDTNGPAPPSVQAASGNGFAVSTGMSAPRPRSRLSFSATAYGPAAGFE